MSLQFYSISLIIALTTLGCGGGSSSDNPPNVAGRYECVGGCDGICNFPEVLLVNQVVDAVSTTADGIACTGSIDNDGNFSGVCSGPSQTCDGNFAAGVFTADCNIGGVSCQTVAYSKV